MRAWLGGLLLSGLASLTQLSASPFTYQGRLSEGGVIIDSGQYEMTFILWDAASEGKAVGSPVIIAPVATDNGIFNVTLDFGLDSFNGAARWLQISVRNFQSTEERQVLSPRQPVNSAPQAIIARSVVDGSITASKVGGILNSSSIPNLDASKLTTGVLKDSLLSSAIARSSDVDRTIATQLTQLLSGATFASADPADSTMLASGMKTVATINAPAWVNGTTTGQLSARSGQSAVWTGQEMIVWGGTIGTSTYSSSGSAYRPDVDTWVTVSTVSAPTQRTDHSAVWTGTEMIIWGGFSGNEYLNYGKKFSLAKGKWSAVSTQAEPTARDTHVAVWAGNRMVIWGGENFTGVLNNGGLYDPTTDTWSSIPSANAPAARSQASAVSTGNGLIVWGGVGERKFLNSGAQLVIENGLPGLEWRTISDVNAPSERIGHTAVWTGSKMIIWGGLDSSGTLGDGAIYDPVANSWAPVNNSNAPTARNSHAAVWTGSEMVVVGGETASGATSTGGAYDPSTDKWRVLSNPGFPVARSGSSAVWTGSEVMVFGGSKNGTSQASLQRLTPQPTWYFYRKP